MTRSDAVSERRLAGYLASALTGLSAEQRRAVFAVSDLVAGVCQDNGVDLYEPRSATDPVNDPSVPDVEVFTLDRHRVVESDFVVFLAHHSSTGAGEELIFAQQSMVQVVIVAPEDARVSRMITGIPSPAVMLRYRTLDELAAQLQQTLADLRPQLLRRDALLARYGGDQFGKRLRAARESRGLSVEALAAQVTPLGWLTATLLDDWEHSSDRTANPSLLHLRVLADALEIPVAELLADQHVPVGEQA